MTADDPRVQASWLLHGANQWPEGPSDLRAVVTRYFDQISEVAVRTQGVSLALGLDADHVQRTYLRRPTRLFRIFRYPPTTPQNWGVGEHTDYGLLTLLAKGEVGGLQVKSQQGWIDAPPIAGILVCNMGDMLERLTNGRFVSTPHRVINQSSKDRLSFPFFYDPDFSAKMIPIDPSPPPSQRTSRWDGEDPHAYTGVYADYLAAKVARVFPTLAAVEAAR